LNTLPTKKTREQEVEKEYDSFAFGRTIGPTTSFIEAGGLCPPWKGETTMTQKGSTSSHSGGQHLSKTTTDHETIRHWAEERGGKPACVQGTGGRGDTGMIRLEFPRAPQSNDDSLQEISGTSSSRNSRKAILHSCTRTRLQTARRATSTSWSAASARHRASSGAAGLQDLPI